MKIVSYNVNGIRARLPRLLEYLDEERPDIVCLQELKTADEGFPAEEIGATLAATFNGTKPSCWRVVNSGAPRKHGGSAWRRLSCVAARH